MAVAVLDVSRALAYSRGLGVSSDEEIELLSQIADRKATVQTEQDSFSAMCDRWDNLYYPDDVLNHVGASHWAWHPSATTPGKAHISLNVPPVYVDVPASLQSVPPVENMVATLPDDATRTLASLVERMYFAWKDEEHYDLKCHQACITKSLYGRTAAKVYWDDEKARPCITIVDQPRNLYLGWGSSDYNVLNWALYTYRQSSEQVLEEWGLEVDSAQDAKGTVIPFVRPMGYSSGVTSSRPDTEYTALEVEIYDYWYRVPKAKQRKKSDTYPGVQMETWNAIFVGNVMVKNTKHAEYEGKLPYLVLFNTYIPGVPNGRPELFDIEPLIREKDERLSEGSQMLSRAVDGQFWQLVGPEAPDTVPNGVVPKANKVVAPGAGNRLESIEPWMPEFQLEAYLSRLDRELADVSGLNDLLRGLAPATVLSSSKAITALVANYEARIRIKRDLFYKWRREVWELAAHIWGRKNSVLKPMLEGMARLEQTAPSLTPRDDMETSAMATNLVNSKLWSLKRGMDRVGVDDPESESDTIRAERTDAALFPADVQVMAQLMTVLQSLGYGAPPGAEEQLGQQAQSMADYRSMLGGGMGMPSMNAPEEQPLPPPEGLPANANQQPLPEQLPGGGLPAGGTDLEAQSMTIEGQAQGRLMQNTPIIESP
jgi:hypothetical protein